MPKKLLLAFAALGIIAIGCAKTTPTQDVAADKAKLQADALSFFDLFARADSEAISNLYAEDAILMPPGEPAVTGRPAIKALLGRHSAGARDARMMIKPGEVTGSGVSGDLGWISGTYTVQDSTGNPVDGGSYLSVHQRVNGAWLYVRDIWNSDRPPVAAPPPVQTPTGRK